MCPVYEYECHNKYPHTGCGHLWEEDLHIEERMIPMDKPCPNCGKKDQIIRKFSSHHFHGVINPLSKMDENFKSEMNRIRSEHPDMKSEYF